MSARTSSSRTVIISSPAGHSAPTVGERLSDVLLNHAWRYVQVLGDLLLAPAVHVLQHDRCVALRRQSASTSRNRFTCCAVRISPSKLGAWAS